MIAVLPDREVRLRKQSADQLYQPRSRRCKRARQSSSPAGVACLPQPQLPVANASPQHLPDGNVCQPSPQAGPSIRQPSRFQPSCELDGSFHNLQKTQNSNLGGAYDNNKIIIKEFDVKLKKLNVQDTLLVYSSKDLCDNDKTVMEKMIKEKDVDKTSFIHQKSLTPIFKDLYDFDRIDIEEFNIKEEVTKEKSVDETLFIDQKSQSPISKDLCDYDKIDIEEFNIKEEATKEIDDDEINIKEFNIKEKRNIDDHSSKAKKPKISIAKDLYDHDKIDQQADYITDNEPVSPPKNYNSEKWNNLKILVNIKEERNIDDLPSKAVKPNISISKDLYDHDVLDLEDSNIFAKQVEDIADNEPVSPPKNYFKMIALKNGTTLRFW